MWILGHTALAYIVLRAIRYREQGPRLVFLVFVFANIIDSLHLGDLRIPAHTSIGALVWVGLWLYAFRKLGLASRREVPMLAAAAFTHVLGDLAFSGFYLLWPVDGTKFIADNWGTACHIVTEIALGTLFLMGLAITRDHWRLERYLKGAMRVLRDTLSLENALWRGHYDAYLYILFTLFALAQLGVYLTMEWSELATVTWYAWVGLFTFALFALTLIKMGTDVLPL